MKLELDLFEEIRRVMVVRYGCSFRKLQSEPDAPMIVVKSHYWSDEVSLSAALDLVFSLEFERFEY